MLQQILRDMFIDPDLLAELNEEQKQILFCKMREEQLRRWKEREAKLEKEGHSLKQTKKGGRHVGFLHGSDGQPWTWVMGDHPDDKSIEEKLEEEAQLKARSLAEEEAAATLRKLQEEEELANKLQNQCATENEATKVIEQLWKQNISSESTVKELPKSTSRSEAENQQQQQQQQQTTRNTRQPQPQETNPLLRKKLNPNMLSCVMSVKEKRSSEILASLHMDRQKSIEEADKQGLRIHSFWMEQEKKAKQEEEKSRLIAKRVREDHSSKSSRRLKTESQIIGAFTVGGLHFPPNKPVPGARCPKGRPPRPSSKEDVLKWYQETELPKGAGLDPQSGQLAQYFHGMINRDRAESLLCNRPAGSFLIRLSDKVWGYGLSYKADKTTKHYLIDVTDNGYQFFGTNQLTYSSLEEFVLHYKTHSMCLVDRELLQHPCPHEKDEINDCKQLVKIGGLDGEVSYL